MDLSPPLNCYLLELGLNKMFMFLSLHSCFLSFEIVLCDSLEFLSILEDVAMSQPFLPWQN